LVPIEASYISAARALVIAHYKVAVMRCSRIESGELMSEPQKMSLIDVALDSTACILMREFGCAELALEFARRKATGQGPLADLYQEAVLQLQTEIGRANTSSIAKANSNS